MMTNVLNRDISEYHTFFLCVEELSPEEERFMTFRPAPYLRPCRTSYENIIRGDGCTIEGCILEFDKNASLDEMRVIANLNGIDIDFVDVRDGEYNRVRLIDLHTGKNVEYR